MKVQCVGKSDSGNCLILVNGVILVAYSFDNIEVSNSIDVEVIPFITSKVSKESFFTLNSSEENKLVIDNMEKASYQAYGVILNTNPLTVDCGSLQLEVDLQDLNVEINLAELRQGVYIYFYIDRLDLEVASKK